MSSFIKKQGSAFYFNIIAGILAIAGLVALFRCSTMTTAYALTALTTLGIGVVIGVLLIGIIIYAPNRWGNQDYLSTGSIVAAIALFTLIIGNVINDRVLLASGLFSFNSGNMVGWSVFYVTVVALVCLLACVFCLIIGAFLKSVK